MNLEKEINVILKHYNIGELKNLKLIYKEWNTSYKIKTTNGNYLLKILNFQNEQDLKNELLIINRLKDKIPISFPISSKNKRPYIKHNKKIVLIYNFLDGKPSLRGEYLPNNVLKELGKYYATIHKTRNLSNIPNRSLYKKVHFFFNNINKSSEEYKIAKKTFQILNKNGFISLQFPKGLIHADLHTENILFDNLKIKAILDFEESHVGPFIYDIGICVLDTCWINNSLSKDRIKAFIDGYETIRILSSQEKKHIIDSAIFAGLYTLYFSVRKDGIGNKENLNHYVVKRFLKQIKKEKK